jgi:spoIIIJ-associated protein
MEPIEITGKSLKEATLAAAEQLGVAPEALTVTLLEESKGLFGRAQVRIQAEVAETAPAPEAETTAGPSTNDAEEPAPKKKARSRAKAKAEPAPEAPEPVAGDADAEVAEEETAEQEVAEEGPAVEATPADAEQFVVMMRALLKSAMLDVKIRSSDINGRYVNLEIDGRDTAFLVGKHGEVLNALQYLVNIIAGRKFAKGVRATIDGNNYRTRREEFLQSLSMKIAEQVKVRGEEAVLDALPAFERRIVHKALDGIEGVTTYSEGEEPNRRVVIAPAD